MAARAIILEFRSEWLSYFLSTGHLHTFYRFESIGLFDQEKKFKIDFQDNNCGSHRNDFNCFWSTGHPHAFYHVSSQLAFRFRRRSVKNDFQESDHGESYFGSTNHPDASYQVSGELAFRFKIRSKKYIFKKAVMMVILDFLSERF